jgi:hypothetical protein
MPYIPSFPMVNPKKIENEMTYLNKTKSQMIWLLKQVITVETKMKMKQQQEQKQQQQQSPQPPK